MPDERRWHAIWTRSNAEQMVHDQLIAKGFEAFLPTVEVWSRKGAGRRRSILPMFPGYLFLHHAVDKSSYVEILKSRGIVRLLGERWDRLAVVPGTEIQAIRKVAAAGCAAQPHPFIKLGRRVRITRGPLSGVEGILLTFKPDKGLLVLSIELLQRSVAVEVDCTLVAAA
ncbi:MAG TPA: transcription termination/antitermination NusG family protein [Candidatus Polarisedimenticolia bacterium]|nr:transcription termination/antitermination NusG family protein [Candidatus Polarisedimenticolia bacterium]